MAMPSFEATRTGASFIVAQLYAQTASALQCQTADDALCTCGGASRVPSGETRTPQSVDGTPASPTALGTPVRTRVLPCLHSSHDLDFVLCWLDLAVALRGGRADVVVKSGHWAAAVEIYECRRVETLSGPRDFVRVVVEDQRVWVRKEDVRMHPEVVVVLSNARGWVLCWPDLAAALRGGRTDVVVPSGHLSRPLDSYQVECIETSSGSVTFVRVRVGDRRVWVRHEDVRMQPSAGIVIDYDDLRDDDRHR